MKRIACIAVALLALTGAFRYGASAQQEDRVVVSDAIYDGDVQLVSFADLDYPVGPRAARIEGVVVIAVRLDGEGKVVGASGIAGPHQLIPDAIANAKKWRFAPNRQRQAVIVYDFDIDDGVCHDRSRSLFLLRHKNFVSIKSCENVVGG
jgi:hypothetical protein